MQQQVASFDMGATVRAAVDAARAGNDLMRVNDTARFIIIEHGLDPLQEPEIIEALCRQCIICGVSIEFQAREGNRQPA
ncbi:MAG TPA: hypothetical protein VGN80_08220 [Devosiaceae bacterium]|jgi:hypothetical protein|nr:hypothetical protein [Devosiaceae bacterium]